MEILEKLVSSADIKDLGIDDLYKLCEDLRCFILSNTSKNGGHLASNLGVVETTVAIHNVFDTSRDRLIFDVGHQCYTHKILTGRKDGFRNLRGLSGVSGFPDPTESEHDAFVSGHASTSVSVALGMARARTALGEDYSVIALIGDGALTGGLAFEGLSDAGQSGEPLIVIINDNEMSITENVGGLSQHLAVLRVRPYYLKAKKVYRKTIAKIPFFGKGLTNFLGGIKSALKTTMRLPSSMFENMGFVYIGPADGHDIKEVCRLLKVAREIAKPVVIHLKTVKGKGYKYAEESPDVYHGVPCFNVGNGEPKEASSKTFAMSFGEAITELAARDRRICAITAAMQSGTSLDGFAEILPKQFYDVGIAEGHAVAMAAGLAKQGMLPVCAIYSTFMQRAYDMLIHDVCLTNQHVVFAVDRAGLVPDDGQTHQGTFDVGMFLQMPNMTVLCPSNISEIGGMLRYAIYEVRGPVAIRYPRGGGDSHASGGDGRANGGGGHVGWGCGRVGDATPPYEPMLLRAGKDAAIVTYGRLVSNAMQAADLLEKQGIDVAVVKVVDISKVCKENLTQYIPANVSVFVVEECVQAGCVASKLAVEAGAQITRRLRAAPDGQITRRLRAAPSLLKRVGDDEDMSRDITIIPINIGSATPPPATTDELMRMYGLDAEGIVATVCTRLS